MILFSLSLGINNSIRGLLFIDKQKNPDKHEKDKPFKSDKVEELTGSVRCPFKGYYCNPSGDDLLESVPGTAGTSAQDCEKLCKETQLCRVFTYFNFRHQPVCHILQDCEEKVGFLYVWIICALTRLVPLVYSIM